MAEERFIAGIYNYCDYWCERCAFTRRCRNFASGHEERRRPTSDDAADSLPDADATNASFWTDLAEKLCEVAMSAKSGQGAFDVADDDLDAAFEPDEEWEAREEARRREQKSHPLALLSHDYMMRVHAWLESADGDLKAVARSLLAEAGNPFAADDAEEQARQIGEMIEVVAWYHTLISAKLHRAVHGLLGREDGEGEVAEIIAESRRADANGSGKVALVGIERSIGAWLTLRGILPANEDEILAMLTLLDRMRRRIHIDLPDSVAFRRPGFDGEEGGVDR